MNVISIAEIVHSIQQVYACHTGGYLESWENTDEATRRICIRGVNKILHDPDISAEELHALWVADKAEQGWRCGETKDTDDKTHPCMCRYRMLPIEQQVKPRVIIAVVNALAPLHNNSPASTNNNITNTFNIYQNT